MVTGLKDKKFALIGKTLGHSWFGKLHGMLADYTYDLCEIREDEIGSFLRSGVYDGFNVATSYKEKVMNYLDSVTDRAREIGCVNTVVRREGKLIGDNTDADSFEWLLNKNKISPASKKVLVLGSGSTSKAVVRALEKLGAAEIVIVSRTGDNNYRNLDIHDNAHIIVNTTPVGMFPDVENSPLSIRYFRDLEAVIDIIYNPSRTELMLEAESCGIRAVGGIEMLTYQAKEACELFIGRKISSLSAVKAMTSLSVEMKNIILVGMPGCGKSTVAKELAKFTCREVIDTDDAVERTVGISIPEIFEIYGEDYFRKCESAVIKGACFGSGTVIATGGGAILREDNIKELRRNSVVVFLRREIERLATDSRALRDNFNALSVLYKERIPLYLAASDVIVDVCDTPRETMKAVLKAIYARN